MSQFFRYFFYFKFDNFSKVDKFFYTQIHEILFPVEHKKN